MVNRSDLIVGKGDFMMSLSKLTGKKVVDVTFYIVRQYGSWMMKVCDVVFEDGSTMGVEGEHDFPYLTEYTTYPMPNTDEESLREIYEQSDDFKDEQGTEDDE